ncbi:head GIN domain-containing protein [Pedobacter sp. MR2016-24]|uniref:head GIN domain-containing protein n=1 Tax=Pedobacter sp. MR2016-24 TaxID=2994466 RepID=UPI002248062D|nr:head GIN domain-containing protein [Pedobacter sp. MR2016-24]MCX2485421.1 DUF2807 domain-containing protein [Pedobacter sp. MR2016-24]
MKKLNTLLLLAFLSFFAKAGSASSPIDMHQSFLQDERQIGAFKGIAAGGPLNIQVTIGNKESVRLEGDEEAIADLITEIKDGILIIRPKTKWNDWSRRYRNVKVTAYISARRLNSLTMSGSGSMEILDPINSSELVTTLSGSGSIKAAANLKSFTGVISGSGSLNLKGKANNSNITLSGSGSFMGKSFSVNDLSAQISGSASIFINAQSSIEAVISGSGNILYTGDPKIKKTVLGSGRVSKL